MYVPSHFSESSPDELQRIIRENPLGALVTHTASGLDANHLPFLLDPRKGPLGVLIAHVARANPVWTTVADGAPALVIFRGAQGYISPNWYPGKHETHRRVPTWNYEVVHAHGRIRIHDDARITGSVVARLTHQQEASQSHPWKMSDAPPDYLAEQIRRIVGIEIEITQLEGKRKLNQHHSSRDFDGMPSRFALPGLSAVLRARSSHRRVRRTGPAPS